MLLNKSIINNNILYCSILIFNKISGVIVFISINLKIILCPLFWFFNYILNFKL